jgi:hypothetical protein
MPEGDEVWAFLFFQAVMPILNALKYKKDEPHRATPAGRKYDRPIGRPQGW